MAIQTLEFNATSGLTISCKLFAIGSDTVIDTQTATEKTNALNRYTVDFTDAPAQATQLIGFVGGVGGFVNEIYDLTAATATFYPRSEALVSTAESIADAVWDEVLTGATHNVASSAGRRLRQVNAGAIFGGTATAGSTNSITLAGGSATDQIYDSNLIVIVAGTGSGQTRIIVEYDGTTKVATVDRLWEVTPDATSEFEIIASHQADISHHGLAQGGAASTITLSSTASSVDDTYNDSFIFISTSNGSGQTRLITDYNGTSKVATVTPAWTTEPTSASVYKILPSGQVNAVLSAATQATIDAILVDTGTTLPAQISLAQTDLDALTDTHWTWIDPDNGDAGGDGSLTDPVLTLTQAVALGNSRIKFVPKYAGQYSCEVVTMINFALLDLNGWRLINADNITHKGSVVSSSVGANLSLSTSTNFTFQSGAYVEDVTLVSGISSWFIINYGYFQSCVFRGSTSGGKIALTATNDRTAFYGCTFGFIELPTVLDFTASSGSNTGAKMVNCYGDVKIVGLKVGQVIEHYGWGKLTIDASCSGGTIRHTSHVEITDEASGAVTFDLVSDPGTAATPADVNAQMLDVLTTDTFAELASPPSATSSLKDKITWLFQWMRNKSTQTSTERKLYADNTTTVISTSAVSDDGTTFTKGEEA